MNPGDTAKTEWRVCLLELEENAVCSLESSVDGGGGHGAHEESFPGMNSDN
jgi:hypothetical protein